MLLILTQEATEASSSSSAKAKRVKAQGPRPFFASSFFNPSVSVSLFLSPRFYLSLFQIPNLPLYMLTISVLLPIFLPQVSAFLFCFFFNIIIFLILFGIFAVKTLSPTFCSIPNLELHGSSRVTSEPRNQDLFKTLALVRASIRGIFLFFGIRFELGIRICVLYYLGYGWDLLCFGILCFLSDLGCSVSLGFGIGWFRGFRNFSAFEVFHSFELFCFGLVGKIWNIGCFLMGFIVSVLDQNDVLVCRNFCYLGYELGYVFEIVLHIPTLISSIFIFCYFRWKFIDSFVFKFVMVIAFWQLTSWYFLFHLKVF